MTNTIPYLDQALKINDALLGLPALPLVFLGCLACGYMLKTLPFYKNRWIPAGNFVFGIVANLMLSGTRTSFEIGQAFILGIVAATAAWIAHRRWLSSWIDEKYFDPEDTTQIEKPKKENEPRNH